MYYNFRFYDPSIGRFVSPDDRIFPDKLSGMNKYMYVGGNPIMMNDPTGHKGNAWVHMSNQLIKRGMKEVVFQAVRAFVQSLSPELRFALGFLSSGGKISYMNKKKSGYLKTAGRKMGEAWGFGKRLGRDASFRKGVLEGVADYIYSSGHNLENGKPQPFLTYHHGGFMVHNSRFADKEITFGFNGERYSVLGWGTNGRSYVSGGIGHLQGGESSAIRKHEAGHMRQSQMNSAIENWPTHEGVKFAEYEADLMQGTMNYNASPFHFRKFYGEGITKMIALTNLWYLGSSIFDGYSHYVRANNYIYIYENPNDFIPEYNRVDYNKAIELDIWNSFL